MVLISIHAMGAAILKTPEIELSQPEAHSLASASAQVLRHYPAVVLPAQTVDWIALMSVIGMAYGPRLVAIRQNRMNRQAPPAPVDLGNFNDLRAAAPKEAAARPVVTPIRPMQPAPGPVPSGMQSVDIPGMPGVRILRPVS